MRCDRYRALRSAIRACIGATSAAIDPAAHIDGVPQSSRTARWWRTRGGRLRFRRAACRGDSAVWSTGDDLSQSAHAAPTSLSGRDIMWWLDQYGIAEDEV